MNDTFRAARLGFNFVMEKAFVYAVHLRFRWALFSPTKVGYFRNYSKSLEWMRTSISILRTISFFFCYYCLAVLGVAEQQTSLKMKCLEYQRAYFMFASDFKVFRPNGNAMHAARPCSCAIAHPLPENLIWSVGRMAGGSTAESVCQTQTVSPKCSDL